MKTKNLEMKRAPVVPDEAGSFSAIVYRTDSEPDGDGDVITANAITDGTLVVVSVGAHDVIRENAEPAGQARLYHEGNAVVAVGRAFDTARGRLLRSKLREPDLEWSVGFTVTASRRPTREERRQHPSVRRIILKWRVDEISPVTVGSCGPTCATLVSKDAKCSSDAPCGACAQRETLRREKIRFEYRRAMGNLDRAKRVLDAVNTDRLALEGAELKAHEVPRDMREAAARAAELAAEILGVQKPAIRWYDWPAAVEVGAKGMAWRGEQAIWIARRDDGDDEATYRTAAHEVGHVAGLDEPRAKGFGDALSVLRHTELHVGARTSFEDRLVQGRPDPCWKAMGLAAPTPRPILVAGLRVGSLVADDGVVFERIDDGWRRVAALVA